MQLSADPDNPEYQAMASLMQAAGLETTSLNLLRAATPNAEAAATLIKWMAEPYFGLRISDCGLPETGDSEILTANSDNSGSDNPQSAIRNPQFLALAAAVDESGYALGAWVSALLAAHAWLAEHGLRALFGDTLEYVRCCAAAGGGNVPLTDLRGTVLEMLDSFGIDAARPLP